MRAARKILRSLLCSRKPGGYRGLLRGGVAGGVVLFEKIAAKVVGEIAPHRMDVVAVALRLIEFHEEVGGLDPVIVGLEAFGASSPREPDIGAGFFDLRLS